MVAYDISERVGVLRLLSFKGFFDNSAKRSFGAGRATTYRPMGLVWWHLCIDYKPCAIQCGQNPYASSDRCSEHLSPNPVTQTGRKTHSRRLVLLGLYFWNCHGILLFRRLGRMRWRSHMFRGKCCFPGPLAKSLAYQLKLFRLPLKEDFSGA